MVYIVGHNVLQLSVSHVVSMAIVLTVNNVANYGGFVDKAL